MKKLAFALSALAMSVSTAMATPTDLAPGTPHNITLSGTFEGTAVPCQITTVPAALTQVHENGSSDSTNSVNSGEFIAMATTSYIPQITVGIADGADQSLDLAHTVASLFTVKTGQQGSAANTFTTPSGAENMTKHGTPDSVTGYSTYKTAILFEGNTANTLDKFEQGETYNISTEVTIECVAAP